MKKSGKVQFVYKPTDKLRERNLTYSFIGLWQFLKVMWKAYKTPPDKFYVFFDEQKQK